MHGCAYIAVVLRTIGSQRWLSRVHLAGLLTLQQEQDTAYGLTLVWSLLAVYAKHKHTQSVMAVSITGFILLFIATAATLVQKQRQRKYSALGGGLDAPLRS